MRSSARLLPTTTRDALPVMEEALLFSDMRGMIIRRGAREIRGGNRYAREGAASAHKRQANRPSMVGALIYSNVMVFPSIFISALPFLRSHMLDAGEILKRFNYFLYPS